MIKSVQLKNFQSHEDSTVEFCSGVNVTTGKSDSGKSSILRALYWVLTNRPSTTEFIRKGSGSTGKRGASKLGTCEVQIKVERDGKEIEVIRTRGEGINSCSVDKKKFSTIGKDVPEEVLQALNLDKINIQRQLDQPFLILDSPGAVAAQFNRYTNLDRVDGVVQMLASELRDQQSRKSLQEEQLVKVEEDLLKFKYLEDFEKMVDVLEEIQAEYNKKSSDAEILTSRILDNDALQTEIQQAELSINILFPQLEKAKLKVDGLTEFAVAISEFERKILSVTSIIDNIGRAQATIDAIRLELPSLTKEIELQKLLFETDVEGEKVILKCYQLDELIAKISGCEEGIVSSLKIVKQNKKLLQDAKKEFEGVDTCVTCGQKLLGDSKQVMLENLG